MRRLDTKNEPRGLFAQHVDARVSIRVPIIVHFIFIFSTHRAHRHLVYGASLHWITGTRRAACIFVHCFYIVPSPSPSAPFLHPGMAGAVVKDDRVSAHSVAHEHTARSRFRFHYTMILFQLQAAIM